MGEEKMLAKRKKSATPTNMPMLACLTTAKMRCLTVG